MASPCSYGLVIGDQVVDVQMNGADSERKTFHIQQALPLVITLKSFCTADNPDMIPAVLASLTVCGQQVGLSAENTRTIDQTTLVLTFKRSGRRLGIRWLLSINHDHHLDSLMARW